MPTITHKTWPAEMIYMDFIVNMHGTRKLRVARPDIHWNANVFSHVLVTATEFNRNPAALFGIDSFVGDARVSVNNIAVREGEAIIWLDVAWNSDLPIYVRMHVINMQMRQARFKKGQGPELLSAAESPRSAAAASKRAKSGPKRRQKVAAKQARG